jgi:hypothetical protein
MGRGGTGLSSCANAWSGAAVTSKKDTVSLPSISLPKRRQLNRHRELCARKGQSVAARLRFVERCCKSATVQVGAKRFISALAGCTPGAACISWARITFTSRVKQPLWQSGYRFVGQLLQRC